MVLLLFNNDNSNCECDVSKNLEVAKLIMANPDSSYTILLDTSYIYKTKYNDPSDDINRNKNRIKKFFSGYYEITKNECEWIQFPNIINPTDSFYSHIIVFGNNRDSVYITFWFRKKRIIDNWKFEGITYKDSATNYLPSIEADE